MDKCGNNFPDILSLIINSIDLNLHRYSNLKINIKNILNDIDFMHNNLKDILNCISAMIR